MRITRTSIVFLITCIWAGVGHSQVPDSYVLRGTLVTPSSIVPNGMVLVTGDKISAVGANIDVPGDIKTVETESFLFPGLIDLHNHLTWNLFPRWPPPGWKPSDWDPARKFGARYDWQQLQSYKDSLDTPHRLLVEEGWGCEMNRYGEVKALAGGATSSVGSLGPLKCVEGLARDLDFYSGFYHTDVFDQEKLAYNIFPLEMLVGDAESVRSKLASGQLNSFIIHLAEGAADNASAAREYQMLVAQGFLRPGVSIVHGVALRTPQFHDMATHGVGLIWSPRSNFELYGTTVDVRSAKNAGVAIAIAPDWSPSGSSGMLEELNYAEAWNNHQSPKVFTDADLAKMATSFPAQLAGLSDKIGSLSRGFFADLLLMKKKGMDPYSALLHASPLDVRLVVVGGSPVYGDRDLMEKLLPQAVLEPVTICHEESAKVLNLDAQSSQGGLRKTWRESQEQLASALRQWNIPLAALAEDSECGK